MKKSIISIIAIVLLGAILLASCTNDIESNSSVADNNSSTSYNEELNGSNSNVSETTTIETVSDVTSSDETSSIESEDSEANMSQDESEPDTSSSNDNNSVADETSSNSNETSTHKHNYKKTVVNPTCTEKGYTKNVCSCGDSYISDEKPTVEHNMKIESEVASTQNTRGKCVYKCSYGCGTTKTEEFYSIDELCKLISKYTLQYINEFRVAEGKPALIVSKKVTEFAEYRAQQALQGGEHRGHNDADSNLAAEATKCGKYQDYSRYDPSITVGWFAEGMEAYGMGGAGFVLWSVVGDDSGVKSAAIQVAEACHNSSSHWAYVGDKNSNYSDYIYVGVGTSLTYNGGLNNYVVVYRYNPDETGYKYHYADENGNFYDEWVKP